MPDVTKEYEAQAFVIGQALQRWQNIESGLFAVFQAPFKDVPHGLMSIVYFHIRSFETKLALVDDALSIVLNKEQLTFWGQLRKEATIGATYRNAYAHFDTHFRLPGQEVVAGPSVFDIARRGGPFERIPDRLLHSIGRIKAATGAFWNLSGALHDFAERIHWSPTVQATRKGRLQLHPELDLQTPPKMHWPQVP